MKKGWESKTLGDVCHVYQPETISQKQMVAGDIPVYGANGQIGWHNQFNHEAPELILGCRGSCGTVHTTDPRAWINGNAMVVRPKAGVIDLAFLAYALRGGIEISDAITGAAQPQITRTSLMPIAISFPASVPDQQRIVGVLDEAFARLATAKANAEKNLQNARALFENHLQSVFTQRGKGWVEKRLDGIAKFSQGIQVGLGEQSTALDKGLVRFIRIIDYTQGTEDVRYVKDPGARYAVQETDLVMIRYGTPGVVGRGIAGVIANNLFKISVLDGSVTNDFLAYFLAQRAVQNYLGSQGASTMPALTFKQLGQVVVSFPSALNEQNVIVEKLDALATETQRLATIYERKLAALEALKKSLLHQAFTGEL